MKKIIVLSMTIVGLYSLAQIQPTVPNRTAPVTTVPNKMAPNTTVPNTTVPNTAPSTNMAPNRTGSTMNSNVPPMNDPYRTTPTTINDNAANRARELARPGSTNTTSSDGTRSR